MAQRLTLRSYADNCVDTPFWHHHGESSLAAHATSPASTAPVLTASTAPSLAQPATSVISTTAAEPTAAIVPSTATAPSAPPVPLPPGQSAASSPVKRATLPAEIAADEVTVIRRSSIQRIPSVGSVTVSPLTTQDFEARWALRQPSLLPVSAVGSLAFSVPVPFHPLWLLLVDG